MQHFTWKGSAIQDKLMPLPAEFVQDIRPEDKFLLAYPRSGSRWIRELLHEFYLISKGEELRERYGAERVELNATITSPKSRPKGSGSLVTEAHTHRREKSPLYALGEIPIFRSHHLTEPLRRASGPVAYFVRRPDAVMHSYYRFAQIGGHVAAEMSLEEFSEYRVREWSDHVTSMLEARQVFPGRVRFYAYRDGGPYTADDLRNCATHLRLPNQPELAEGVIERFKTFLAEVNAHPQLVHGRGNNDWARQHLPTEFQDRVTAATREVVAAAWAAAEEDAALGLQE